MIDYRRLLQTMEARRIALQLVAARNYDPTEDHRSMDFIHTESDLSSGKISETELRGMSKEQRLRAFAELLKSTRKAAPTQDFHLTFPVLDLFDRIPTVGESVVTADDLKDARKEFVGHIDRVKEVIGFVKRAADDIRERKSSKQAKQRREEEKQQATLTKQTSQAAAQIAKAKNKDIEREAARQKQQQKLAADELAGRTVAQWTIMDIDLKHHIAIRSVDFATYSSNIVDADKPYIISGVELQSMHKHNSVVDVWISGFERNPTVQQKGRGVWPLKEAGSLHDELLALAPKSEKHIQEGNSAYNHILDATSLFGYLGVMRNSAGEVHSLASLRWQRSGSRRVVIANVSDIVSYLQEEAEPKKSNPTAADVSATLKFADAAVVSNLRARGAMLHHATVNPGDVLYQPCGWWVLEVPCNGELNFGVHIALLPKVAKSSHSGQGFAEMCRLKLRSVPANAPVQLGATQKCSAIWLSVLSPECTFGLKIRSSFEECTLLWLPP